MARTAVFAHAPPLPCRCLFRSGSCAEGDWMPSAVSPSAIARTPFAGHVLGEDPADDGRGGGVRHQLVQPGPVRRLGRVGVRPGVAQHVAVRGPAAQEPALSRRLRGHGGADADLDAAALPLAHAAVQAHHHVMGVGAGVDCAAHLRHPQLDAQVDEQREDQPELVAVEHAVRLAAPSTARSPTVARILISGGAWPGTPGRRDQKALGIPHDPQRHRAGLGELDPQAEQEFRSSLLRGIRESGSIP